MGRSFESVRIVAKEASERWLIDNYIDSNSELHYLLQLGSR